jgi:hypothetical protein
MCRSKMNAVSAARLRRYIKLASRCGDYNRAKAAGAKGSPKLVEIEFCIHKCDSIYLIMYLKYL